MHTIIINCYGVFSSICFKNISYYSTGDLNIKSLFSYHSTELFKITSIASVLNVLSLSTLRCLEAATHDQARSENLIFPVSMHRNRFVSR